MSRILTLAVDRYDRHFPLFFNSAELESNFEIRPLEVGMVGPRRNGVDRHKRLLTTGEFDIAECSLASYLISQERHAEYIALPIFPRRLFSQFHTFVRKDSGLTHPKELEGKSVLVWAHQVTMSVQARGDFVRRYDVDWRKIKWYALHEEEVPLRDSPILHVFRGSDPAQLLEEKIVDAFIYPHPPEEILNGSRGFRHLSPNVELECQKYYLEEGFVPIMHVIALKKQVLDRRPELPVLLRELFDNGVITARKYYEDPAFSFNPLERASLDRTEALRPGSSIWLNGLQGNERNLDFFLNDMFDQGLLARPLDLKKVFKAS